MIAAAAICFLLAAAAVAFTGANFALDTIHMPRDAWQLLLPVAFTIAGVLAIMRSERRKPADNP